MRPTSLFLHVPGVNAPRTSILFTITWSDCLADASRIAFLSTHDVQFIVGLCLRFLMAAFSYVREIITRCIIPLFILSVALQVKRDATLCYLSVVTQVICCVFRRRLRVEICAEEIVMVAVRTCMVVGCSSIDCCSFPDPSSLSVERLLFIEAWVITALWPKCSCSIAFSYVLCVVWTGCFCRTTIIRTILWFLVCWNSVL